MMRISADGREEAGLPTDTNEIIGHHIKMVNAGGGHEHYGVIEALDVGHRSFKLYTSHPNFKELEYRGIRTIGFGTGPTWWAYAEKQSMNCYVHIYFKKRI